MTKKNYKVNAQSYRERQKQKGLVYFQKWITKEKLEEINQLLKKDKD